MRIEIESEQDSDHESDFPPAMRPPLQGRSVPLPQRAPRALRNQSEELVVKQNRALKEARKEYRENKNNVNKTKKEIKSNEQVSRKVPTIIEDIIISPPRYTTDNRMEPKPLSPVGSTEWIKAVSRKTKREMREKGKEKVNKTEQRIGKDGKSASNKAPIPQRRPPRTAAVAIKDCSENFSYADTLKKAREKINLSEIRIDQPKIRKAANGGLIIEVAGADGVTKANALTNKLKEALDDNVQITRPTKKGDVRLIGLDDSISADEVASVVSDAGGCTAAEVKVGPIRQMRSGLGIVVAQCPLGAAIRASSTSKIRIGWTMAKIELLRARPLQCFRYWEYGHIGNNCRNTTDRSGSCFNSGNKNHKIQDCQNRPCCPVCRNKGYNHEHRIGGGNCQSKSESGNAARRTAQFNTNNV